MSLFLVLAASVATPQIPVTTARAPRHDRIHYDVASDGATWCRGRTYKARFGGDGATYVPFLGSSAPRNFPLGLALASARAGDAVIELAPAARAVRQGNRVTIDRGVVDEVYELSLDSVEQLFVVESKPAVGDLRLVVSTVSELARAEREDGFTFSNELGGVHYGRAFLRDARGAKTPVETRLVEGGVEIVVPAAELERANYPLVIDPILTTFGVATGAADTLDSDCAWDRTDDVLLVVMDEVFSATDHDAYVELADIDGVQVDSGYADTSTEDWRNPRCANVDIFDQFMIVASVDNFGAFVDPVIVGRATQSNPLVFDPKFQIDGGLAGAKLTPDIGGDPTPSLGSGYLVTWTLDDGSGSYMGVWRKVNVSSALTSNVLGGTVSTIPPHMLVGRSNGGGAWTVVAQVASGANVDLLAVEIDPFTALFGANGVLATVGAGVSNVAISSRNVDDRWVVAFQDTTSNNDVRVLLVDGLTVIDDEVVAALEGGATAAEDQRLPSVETDGQQFLVAYCESVGGNPADFDVKLTQLHDLNGQLGVSDGHVAVSGSLLRDLRPSVTSAYVSGGVGAGFAFSWDRDTGANRDVRAGFYTGLVGGPITSYCSGDGSGTACPCGNVGGVGRGCGNSASATGAVLTATGNASLGGDTLVLQAAGVPSTATCLFFQGTLRVNGGAGNLFGDGLRCAGGSVLRLSIKAAAGGVATYPSGIDAPVSVTGFVPATGATRHYQGWYRDAASFCTVSTFNVTNALTAVWLP